MTDPNQQRFFRKDGKTFKQHRRHKPNARQVALYKYQKSLSENNKGELSNREIAIFKTGFNMGYKEGDRRAKKNSSKTGSGK